MGWIIKIFKEWFGQKPELDEEEMWKRRAG